MLRMQYALQLLHERLLRMQINCRADAAQCLFCFMKKRSFQLALSAVSCALAAVFMIIGLNVPFMFITGYIFAGIALMLPLAENFRAGGFLAYAATSLLCLLFNGIPMFYKLFPFVVFFGLHPLVNSFQRKWKINRWVAWAVKAVWFVGMLCAEWALFSELFAVPFAWIERWAYLLIIAGGAAVFLVYDWLIMRAQTLVDFYVAKISRGGRAKRAPGEKKSAYRDDVYDVFGGDPADTGERGGEEKKMEDAQSSENIQEREKSKEEKDNGGNIDRQ